MSDTQWAQAQRMAFGGAQASTNQPASPAGLVQAGDSLASLLGPASAYADTPKPGDTLLQQPQAPTPPSGPALAFNGAQPQPGNPSASGPVPSPAPPVSGPDAAPAPPPAGMQPFTSPQNLQTLQTKPVTLPIGGQAPQAAPQAAPAPPATAPQSGPTIQALMKAAQNPWLMANPGNAAIVKLLLQQKMQAQDPGHALDLQLKQAQVDKARQPNVHFVPNASHDAFGNPIGGFVNTDTGQIKLAPGQTGPDTPGAVPAGADLHGEDFLKTLPSAIGSQVKAYSEGKMPLPAGYALKSPYFQKMLQMITQYDPTFDAVNYNARSKTRNDFTSGKSAQSINALNTVIGHLQTLSDSADSLNNGSYPLINKVENWALNATGDPRIKQFDTTKKAVVDELTRVWRGSGGSEGDIKTWSDQINASNSPAQLHTVIGQIGELLQSKINSLRDTYKQGMGTAAQPIQFVTPQSQQALKTLEGRAAGTSAAAPASAQPATKTIGGKTYINQNGQWYEQ